MHHKQVLIFSFLEALLAIRYKFQTLIRDTNFTPAYTLAVSGAQQANPGEQIGMNQQHVPTQESTAASPNTENAEHIRDEL